MTNEHRFRDDLAAYALGALDPAQADALQRHLTTCTICSDELDAFEQTVRALPDQAPSYTAPPALRKRVRAEIRRPTPPPGVLDHRRPRAPRTWLHPALAGGSILAAIAVALVIAVTQGGGPAVRVYPATVRGSTGGASLRVSGSHGELRVRGLPSPAAGHVYELWLERRHGPPQPTPALFGVDHAGAGDVDVPGSLRGVVRIIVTQEPNGGSRTPTLPAVITAQLT